MLTGSSVLTTRISASQAPKALLIMLILTYQRFTTVPPPKKNRFAAWQKKKILENFGKIFPFKIKIND